MLYSHSMPEGLSTSLSYPQLIALIGAEEIAQNVSLKPYYSVDWTDIALTDPYIIL